MNWSAVWQNLFRARWFAPLLVCLIALGPFLININDEFLSDDWEFIRIVRESSRPITHYFTANYSGERARGSYRPMVDVFWFSMYRVAGLHSWPYHAANTALHVGNALLLYAIVAGLPWIPPSRRRGGAFFSAVTFAILPNHAESVAWIAAVNDTMATFFYLGSLFLLLQAWRKNGRWRAVCFSGSLFGFLFSLLAKEIAISLPFVVGIAAWLTSYLSTTTSGRDGIKTIGRAMALIFPYLLILGAYFAVRFYATGVLFGYYAHDFTFTRELLIFSSVSMILNQVVGYSLRTPLTFWLIGHLGAVLTFVAIILVTILAYFFRRARRVLLPGAGLVVLWQASLVPVSSFVVATLSYGSEEGERWTYLPSVFLATLCGLGGYWLWRRARRRGAICRTGLIILAIAVSGYWIAQLNIKTGRWHEAAQIVARSGAEAQQIIAKEKYDGVVVVGRPETYHGAMMFRNGIIEALSYRAGVMRDVMPVAYTWYAPESNFRVTQVDRQTFDFEESSGAALIVLSPTIASHDFTSHLDDVVRERLTGEYRGSRLTLRFSDDFIAENGARKKKIGLLFFNHGKWSWFTIATPVVTFQNPSSTISAISLPAGAQAIDHILYHAPSNQLFATIQKKDGTHGVWTYREKEGWAESLSVPKKFFTGHLFQDVKGNIYYSANTPARLYRTADHGRTWSVVLENVDVFWGLADAGGGVLYGSLWSHNLPAIWRSLDQGQTWREWKNLASYFPGSAVPYMAGDPRNKLRHLHDIVAWNKTIIVGTGDVARWTLCSDDGGETWRQIWGEGYTGHIFDAQKQLLLLGADGNENFGLARYFLSEEKAVDVWRPASLGWTKYIYSLAASGGRYYAGVHIENNVSRAKTLYGILVSNDGEHWERLIEWQDTKEFNTVFIAAGRSGDIFASVDGLLYQLK